MKFAVQEIILRAGFTKISTLQKRRLSKTYILVGYANGPGFKFTPKENGPNNITCARPLPSETEEERNNPEENSELLWPSSVHRNSETHGGDDVAVTAQGPWV